MYWGRRAAKLFPTAPHGMKVDAGTILEFLRRRRGPDGRPVSVRLGPLVDMGDGWNRLSWRGLSEEEERQLGEKGWVRAWHGCKLGGLYSILYHGRLFESHDESQGHRMKTQARGVYVHKDGTARKANNYIRFEPLCGDGVLWAAKWEVRVNRSDGIGCGDQWVIPARSVRLAALWICGRTATDMRPGDEVCTAWDPELEADPVGEQGDGKKANGKRKGNGERSSSAGLARA